MENKPQTGEKLRELAARHVKQNGQVRKQALHEHLEHVTYLVRTWCGTLGISALGQLSGKRHDTGKAELSWQDKLDVGIHKLPDHAFVGAWELMWLADELNDPYVRLALRMISIAVAGHHTGMPDSVTPKGKDGLKLVFDRQDETYARRALEALAQSGIASDMRGEGILAGEEVRALKVRIESLAVEERERHFMLGFAQRFLASALIDADRLDAMCFEEKLPFPPSETCPDWVCLMENLEAWRKKQNPGKTPKERAIHAARNVQFDACCAAGSAASPGIWQLGAVTGSGKTGGAIAFALKRLIQGATRLIYVAPYRALLRQTADSLQEMLGTSAAMVLHTSDVAQADEEHELYAQNWSSPIVLTTLAQFMNTLFSGHPRRLRRFHRLQGAVIVLDEPQCIPPCFTRHMIYALRALSRLMGATVVLTTATAPILIDAGLSIDAKIDALTEKQMRVFDRVRVVDKTVPPIRSESVAKMVCEAEMLSTLMVFNTRATAAAAYEAITVLAPEQTVYFVTGDLCPAHRNDVIEALRLGLLSPGCERIVCVSTQTLQAGVDLSFQRGVRALCGLDEVHQVAGRVNRGGESDIPRELWLVDVEDETIGSLDEIRIGKICARDTIRIFADRSESILSPEALADYRRRFLKQADSLIEDAQAAKWLDCLTSNIEGKRNWPEHNNAPLPLLRQAFRTAGDEFIPLEGAGDSVIVPWGKGAQIIEALREKDLSPKCLRELIIRAQPYSVSVWPDRLRNLRKAGLTEEINGAIAVKKEAYDRVRGLM